MNFFKTFLILCSLSLITGCSPADFKPQLTIQNPNQSTFNIDIAYTPETRKQGLMFVEHLPQNQGMFFSFPELNTRNFWMKNTLIPLDIIFANNYKIVKIHHNVPPCKSAPCPTYNSEVPANQVLEINGGLSQQLDIKPGQTWTLSIP